MRTASRILRVAALAFFVSFSAEARPFRFEPTDLEMVDSGLMEVDAQFGGFVGKDSRRLALPDYEIAIGLTKRVEFDLDGMFGFGGEHLNALHTLSDPLWPSAKLGLIDDHDRDAAFSLGLQLGPRLPTNDYVGIGYQALALFGLRKGHAQFVFNGGALVDPSPRGQAKRPWGFLGGIDFALDLDHRGEWSVISQLGIGHYGRIYEDFATLSGGFAWQVNSKLELSAIALASPFTHDDRLGVLFGVSPRFQLF